MGRYNRILVFFSLLFIANLTFAQTIKGVLVDSKGIPQPGIEVQLLNTDYVAYTNGSGVFRFFDLKQGDYTIVTRNDATVSQNFTISGSDVNLESIVFSNSEINEADNQITVISVDDLDQIEDDNNGVSSVLTASRDPYNRAVAYNLSVLRYRSRGYNNEDVGQFLNGMPVNDLDDGRVFWNNWGGLNDVLRVQTNDLNLRASDFAFGELGGASFIDLRASSQRVQKKVVYSLSNRSYTHRLMYTHSTGMQENGWAFTFSGSKRWAQSGFIDGTHYDAYSYFMSVDRKLTNNQTLNFVFLGAPLRRGKVGPTVQEALDLAGNNFYNPNWGYQAGQVRNAREDRVHQPIAMLRHDIDLGTKTKIMTTVGFQTGKYGNTRLDWYLAPDPRPDYYRKLPSFQLTDDARLAVTDFFSSDENNRQLNWDNMYKVNRERPLTVYDIDGIPGNNKTGNLAAYVIEEQRFDTEKLSLNSIFTHNATSTLSFNGGITLLHESTHNFKVLDDLLGADFYVDYDDFALRDFPDNNDAKQNDLNNPNRILQEGDVFGFNYNIVTRNLGGWGQVQYAGKHLDLFASAKVENVSFYRDGQTRVGTFPENSFGKSEVSSFLTYGTKVGATYKINGRNYLYAVGGYRTRAPFSRFAFISPRTRQDIVNGLTTEKILSAEAGYSFVYSKLKGRISTFYTQYKDQLDNSSFYFDQANTFVNYIMNGVDKQHSGVEGGFELTLPYGFSIEAAGAINQNFYTSRPLATISQDNSATELVVDRTVYIKNYYVPGPQTAGSITLGYRMNGWFGNITGSFVGDNYLDFNPDRRTVNGVEPVSKVEQPELWNEIIAQEKLPSIFTLNLFVGKSFRINGHYTSINASVGNLLNRTDLRTGGFEQYRFDYEEKNIDKFPPKYFYSYGRNYSFNFSISF